MRANRSLFALSTGSRHRGLNDATPALIATQWSVRFRFEALQLAAPICVSSTCPNGPDKHQFDDDGLAQRESFGRRWTSRFDRKRIKTNEKDHPLCALAAAFVLERSRIQITLALRLPYN